jgi:hypothetical protein
MPIYRVGASGVRVLNQQGQAIATLRPGSFVEGALRPLTQAEITARPELAKRIPGYADKKIRPAEDKSL